MRLRGVAVRQGIINYDNRLCSGYSAAMSAQQTIALQTELHRPNPLYI
jgi:hypothetical protein